MKNLLKDISLFFISLLLLIAFSLAPLDKFVGNKGITRLTEEAALLIKIIGIIVLSVSTVFIGFDAFQILYRRYSSNPKKVNFRKTKKVLSSLFISSIVFFVLSGFSYEILSIMPFLTKRFIFLGLKVNASLFISLGIGLCSGIYSFYTSSHPKKSTRK